MQCNAMQYTRNNTKSFVRRLCFLYSHSHHKLPDYGNGQVGMKRPRYEERPRYEADENQAGTVTFSLISTSFFTAKVCYMGRRGRPLLRNRCKGSGSTSSMPSPAGVCSLSTRTRLSKRFIFLFSCSASLADTETNASSCAHILQAHARGDL